MKTIKNYQISGSKFYLRYTLGLIAALCTCLLMFEYASFYREYQTVEAPDFIDYTDEIELVSNFKIEEYIVGAQKKKQKKSIKNYVADDNVLVQRANIEPIKIGNKTLDLGHISSAQNNGTRQLKIAKKAKIYGLGELKMENYPFFKECHNPDDPIAQFKCTQERLLSFLQRNARYPNIPREMGIEGSVHLSFIIDKEGQIKDVNVIRKLDEMLDSEAIRVVNTVPNFEAGSIQGKPINVRFHIPISFKLTKN